MKVMPWTRNDVDSYTQSAGTPDDKKRWTKVANKVLTESGDEDEAVEAANKDADKQQAKKSVFATLVDLAKSFDLAKTTSGPKHPPHFAAAGIQHVRFRKPGFKRTQIRRERNVAKVTSQGKRAYKSTEAEDDAEKGVGNNLKTFTVPTVRKHSNVMQARQNKHAVAAHKKRRFKDSSQMRGIINVGDV